MGQLIDGVWHDTWYDTKSTGGRFKRSSSAYRNWVTPDGEPGRQAKAALQRKKIATIFTSHSPVRGHTAR